MARPLRHFQPGTLVEVTTRTVQGRLLLCPGVSLDEILIGVLGRAQRLYSLEIHLCTFASNHYHLLCSPESPNQLAAFMRFLNSNIAREAGRLHGWREKFWGRRYRAIPVSDEEAAQVERVRYVLSHGCKEGFVSSPRQWPGVHCADALLGDARLTGPWYDRTREYEARRRGIKTRSLDFASPETVVLTRPPCWKSLSATAFKAEVRALIEDIERETARRNRERGRGPLGSEFVEGQDPHERALRSHRSPAPAVHAASKVVRVAMIAAYRAFLAAYRQAAERLRCGDLAAVFPAYCFPPPLPPVPGLGGSGSLSPV